MSSRALAQRRQVNLDDAQPVEQVERNRPAADSARRSRLVAAITWTSTFRVLERADPLHLAVLHRAQQLGLHRQRQFAGFVEEQRAAVGVLEEADLGVGRAGERAAHVAEQLALEQRVRRPPSS